MTFKVGSGVASQAGPRLPREFFFGVANSAYQAEGGFNEGDGPRNNWAVWERTGRVAKSGASVGFYERYQEHIDLAASLGLNLFRMGVDWSRLQPTRLETEGAEPAWDVAALDHYAQMIVAVRSAGMEPLVTLHHFTHPAWCPHDFWLQDDAPIRFAAYVEHAVLELNRRVAATTGAPVRYWITINEPNLLPLNTYMVREMPGSPGQGVAKTRRAWDALLAAHIRAYDVIHDVYEAQGWDRPEVTFNLFCMSIYELDRAFYDLLRARSFQIKRADLGPYLATRRKAFNQRYDALATARWGRYGAQSLYHRRYRRVCQGLFDPTKMRRTLDALYATSRVCSIDYLALDTYDPFVAGTFYFQFPTAARRAAHEPVFRKQWWDWKHEPAELAEMVRVHADGNDNTPIWIMENGIGHSQTKHGMAEPRCDGLTRDQYLRSTLGEVERLVAEGIPLVAFVYWTLVDNFEWGSFQTRLGLYDYDHERQVIKRSDGLGVDGGKAYADLIAELRAERTERGERAERVEAHVAI